MLRPFRQLQRGSAPAEFVLVAGLLVAMSLGVLQLALISHVRQVLTSSAWEGARHASYYNTTLAEGRDLTRQLITVGLGSQYAEAVSIRTVEVAGRPGAEVSVETPFPAFGLWSPGGLLRVRAAVPYEIPG